jgi:hypothetical protein
MIIHSFTHSFIHLFHIHKIIIHDIGQVNDNNHRSIQGTTVHKHESEI